MAGPEVGASDCGWENSKKKFHGSLYTITNKQTGRRMTLWPPGIGDTYPVSPLWLGPANLHPAREWNIDNDSVKGHVTILCRYWTTDGRYLSPGPNARQERNLCRLGTTDDEDVFFISADTTSIRPPQVLADLGPGSNDYGTAITADYNCNQENQKWYIVKV